ncbi:hypothetical protein HCJ45_13120 [Listeria sp. FSL L7-1517]|uniref:hypothetical protein n=1 Tax=Listeria immobilis TaxID=2713502 RepID=UPI00164E0A74|nr:hypothetical protein [Listeria immobilis]MBC6298050.1 hypothetical protein [Listeria immobilis]
MPKLLLKLIDKQMAVLGMIAEICSYRHQLYYTHSALPTIRGQIYNSIGHEAPTIMG